MAAGDQTSGIMTERIALFDTSQKYSNRGQTAYRRVPYNLVRYDFGSWAYESVEPGQECWASPGSNLAGVVITGIQFVNAPDGVLPDGFVSGGGGGPCGEPLGTVSE